MVNEKRKMLEMMNDAFPKCPICGSRDGYEVTSFIKGDIRCLHCQTVFSSVDFNISTKLKKVRIKEFPNRAHSIEISGYQLKRYVDYPADFLGSLTKNSGGAYKVDRFLLESIFLLIMVSVGGYFRLANLSETSSWFDYDEGVYSQAAFFYMRGYMPYKDFFFAHPPLIIYVLSIIYGISGANLGLGRMFSAVLSTLTIAVTYLIGRKIGGLTAGFLASAFVAFDGYTIYNARKVMLEPSMNFFTCLSYLFLFYAFEEDERKKFLIFVSGMLMGLSVSTKIVALFNLMPQLLLFIFKKDMKNLFIFVLALFIPVTMLFLPFLLHAPEETIKQVVFFHLLRPSDGIPKGERLSWMMTHNSDMIIINIGIFSLLAMLIICLVFMVSKKSLPHTSVIVFWASLVLVMFLTAKSFYGHYIEQIIPPLSLLIGKFAAEILNFTRNLEVRLKMLRVPLKITFCIAAISPILFQFSTVYSQNIPKWEDMGPKNVADEVKRITLTSDSILTFEPIYAFMSERQITGLMCDSYGTLLYIGTNLRDENFLSSLLRIFAVKGYDIWPMYNQKAQDYIKKLADQSDYIIIGDWRSEWQMTRETMDYILRRAVIVKDLGYVRIMFRLNSTLN